jgi:pimeloyl-ACP methyl ester carboxylesterase
VRRETLYTRSGDVAIAYQVTGDGPFDVVFFPPFGTHVELVWTTSFAPAISALSSFCRLIRSDKRGTGMSDRVGAPTLETRMDDARAVKWPEETQIALHLSAVLLLGPAPRICFITDGAVDAPRR